MNLHYRKRSQKCGKHNQYIIEFACLDNNNRNPFQCSVCMLKDIGKSQFIYIPEVISIQNNLPIQNWPNGIQQEVLDFLSLNSQSDRNQQIKDKILQFYKELTCQILQKIDDSEQQSLKELEMYQLSRSSLIEFYYQKFKIDQLKEVFLEKEQFDEAKFLQILYDLEQTKGNDILELTQKIQLLEEIENKTSFGQPQQIKEVINQLIKEINFFPLIDDKNQQPPELVIENLQQEQQILDNKEVDFIVQNTTRYLNLMEISKKSNDKRKAIDEIIKNISNKNNTLQNIIENSKQLIMSSQQDLNDKEASLQQENLNRLKQHILTSKQISQHLQRRLSQYLEANEGNLNISSNNFQDIISSLNIELKANINPQSAINNQRSNENTNNSIVKFTNNTFNILPFQEQQCKIVSRNELNNLVFPYQANLYQPYETYYFSQVVIDRDITYILRFYRKKDSIEKPIQGEGVSIGIMNEKCKYRQYGSEKYKQTTIFVPHKEVSLEFEMRVCIRRGFLQVTDSSRDFQKIEILNIPDEIKLIFQIFTNGNELTLTHYEELTHFVPL